MANRGSFGLFVKVQNFLTVKALDHMVITIVNFNKSQIQRIHRYSNDFPSLVQVARKRMNWNPLVRLDHHKVALSRAKDKVVAPSRQS